MMKSTMCVSAALAGILLAGFSSLALANQNLVVNGSFEAGPDPGSFTTFKQGEKSLHGWYIGKGSVDLVGSYFPSSDGQRSLDLDGSPGAGRISQSVNTVPGHLYQLSFDLAANPEGPPTIKTMGVTVAGTSHKISKLGSKTYTPYALQFVALDDRTTVSFESLNQPADSAKFGMLLDNVSVTDITPPTLHQFVGEWDSPWGVIEFRQEGRYLKATYPHDNGRIVGTLSADGRTFEGEWSESPSYKPPQDGGRVYFNLSDDGQALTGGWGYGSAPPSSVWNATRKH
ncbi:MAG: choice-of-anchor C family protein [Cyanobacteria bacterium HKST-UBA03]|nr:choice-of-anchor C family protein [Cyanobacteria bacterium HKST-UBA03]